jgi:hypothetical protein
MRRHPFAIFMAVAVVLALGYSLNDPVPATHPASREPQPPPARPADRTLTKYEPGGGNVAHAAERRTARRTTREPTDAETFAALNGFLLNAFWVLVACLLAWVLWEALLGPVRWRQRRS